MGIRSVWASYESMKLVTPESVYNLPLNAQYDGITVGGDDDADDGTDDDDDDEPDAVDERDQEGVR